MNWAYIGEDNEPYPRFDVKGFRRKMEGKRILFMGSSMVRQQVQALVWTLGHEKFEWEKVRLPGEVNCTTSRMCLIDMESNITICYQFLGSMATKIYQERNFTLDHSLRGYGDSSCVLHDQMIAEFNEFDLVFVQSVAWWLNLKRVLNSDTSPMEWVAKMTPIMYYDAMRDLLSKISQETQTVFVLGQTGVGCINKTLPESFAIRDVPSNYGWNDASKLWDTSLKLIQEERLNVQVVDAREPLMQSVHAHPAPDCLHLCMNSAAVNIYLDMYWVEVFSQFD